MGTAAWAPSAGTVGSIVETRLWKFSLLTKSSNKPLTKKKKESERFKYFLVLF